MSFRTLYQVQDKLDTESRPWPLWIPAFAGMTAGVLLSAHLIDTTLGNTNSQKVSMSVMVSGFKQMLLLKIPAKQGIIAESKTMKC